MKRNGVFSLILTFTILDNLFNVLLFLAGILSIISVTGHHHLSLILCLSSPAVITQPRRFSPTLGRPQPSSAVITHSRPSPVVPLIFLTHARPSFQLPAVFVPLRPSPLLPYRLSMHPIVPRVLCPGPDDG